MSDRLTDFDADEWFDVARQIRPELSRAEFDRTWAEFQRDKANHERKAKAQ